MNIPEENIVHYSLLHENIPCLPENALREGVGEERKGEKQETKYVKHTNQRQFPLIDNFSLEYS